MRDNLLKFLVIFLILSGCSGGSALPQSTIPPPAVENELARSYPVDLAVASPYAAADSEATLIKRLRGRTIGENPAAPIREKIEEIRDILNASSTDQCGFTINFSPQELRAECYGPPIQYQNHPDAVPGAPSLGFLPPGDLGLWLENEPDTDEACAAVQMNHLFTNISGQVDSALGFFASMLCMANNAGVSLPGEGQSVDLGERMNTFMGQVGLSFGISQASLARLANDADGHAVYRLSISGSRPSGGTGEFSLRHVPLNADNTLYRGRLSFRFSSPLSGIGLNCGDEAGMTSAASILYEKRSETQLLYLLRRADFCGADADPFDENDDISPSDKFNPRNPSENPSGWGNNFSQVSIDIDPTTGVGTTAYAWQAGPSDQNTRVFNASLAESQGVLGGCAYYGFGPDIEENTNGEIDRFICNWTGPGAGEFGNKTPVDRVQRQCFSQEEGGTFVSDPTLLNIAYAPTNSCSTTSANFVFGDLTGPFTHDLLPLEELDFILPEAPDDVP